MDVVAAIKIRSWFTDHLVHVRRTLAWFGVNKWEDRADLTQEVFVTAYNALVGGEQVEHPRAWLRACARRLASNYHHKEERRRPHIGDALLIYDKDPEQITSVHQRLMQALAILSEEEQAIIYDIRVDRVRWGKAARERGITIDQARWICERAIARVVKETSRRIAPGGNDRNRIRSKQR